MAKPKSIKSDKYWAYFAPDGYVQSRSISDTKKMARWGIAQHETVDYKDYEKAGYVLRKIKISIIPINPTPER